MNVIIEGNFADVDKQEIYPVKISVSGSSVISVEQTGKTEDPLLPFLLPGFIDAHVHIESSMLVPSEFARLAVVHGTVATVSDPHEIANVCGMEGVQFMISNGKTVPFKFFFGAPACVPATPFETSGARLDTKDVENLLDHPDILYLSEMMNFPGVLNGDPEVIARLEAARLRNKPADGHSPGLRGEDAARYIAAGISTDHECFTLPEALDKVVQGMHILIREGSAAKNFDALWPLIDQHPGRVMFCSDDKHPDSLVGGHINDLCKRAVSNGCNVFHVIRAACINPVRHYRLPVGLLREGDPADFILVDNLRNFRVLKTYINGNMVADSGKTLIGRTFCRPVNRFNCSAKQAPDFEIKAKTDASMQAVSVIHAIDGQLITNKLETTLSPQNGLLTSDTSRDLLKIAVVNRYCDAPVAIAFIHNFGLKQGAIASSVAHDSHNIVAVGVDDESIARSVNLLVNCKGGVSCAGKGMERVLPLPVAGLMSADDGYEVASRYTEIDLAAKSLGCTLSSPFMTLSFMALLVIPHLKLSDLGLFDGDRFDFVPANRSPDDTAMVDRSNLATLSGIGRMPHQRQKGKPG
jgi:adenine deaminase